MDSCCSSSSSRYPHPPRSPDGWFAQPDYANVKFAEYMNGFLREYQSTSLPPKLRYTVLKEADIRERQLQCITQVCSKLCVSRSSAIILLRHCNWNVSMLFDKWFEEEDGVRNKVGLFRNVPPVDQGVGSFTCEICFETYDAGGDHSISSGFCSHLYCRACWAAYVSESISNDGVGCLSLKCPHPRCGAAVGEDLILSVLANKANGDADKAKYSRYLLRSYVEDSKGKRKWCPAPGCDYAVDFAGGYGTCDVSCLCSYRFCSNCNEEGHSPVNCDTVAKWMALKEKDDFEDIDWIRNIDWILENTKPCPKCERNIEKGQGCDHMTCRAPCGFEFCWRCLGAWHGGDPCCNSYPQRAESNHSRRRKEMAKMSLKDLPLDRYSQCYQRWVGNRLSKKMDVEDFHHLVQDVHLKKLSVKYIQTDPVLDFVTEAWQEIIECRRALQWIYVYGYFIPKHERVKRRLFEYLLGEAESGLEKLHHCAKVELEEQIINADRSVEELIEFRGKLIQLTVAIGNYFRNFVRAMENDFPEILVDYWESDFSEASVDCWPCDRCTYVNDSAATACVMCTEEEPPSPVPANCESKKRQKSPVHDAMSESKSKKRRRKFYRKK